MAKRVFDLIVALSAFITLLPVMLLVALLVRLKLGKPVLFRQLRPGLHGEPFEMVKFRTMTQSCKVSTAASTAASSSNPHAPLPDAQRLTPLGRTLRKTSLDELPELWNVVKGDMSLVGPRPLLMAYLPRYSQEQQRRHEVKPGITGWAQVNGRNAITWEEKFRLDVWYVDHHNFWLDLKILCLTVKKVGQREGISHQEDTPMPEFTGKDKRHPRE